MTSVLHGVGTHPNNNYYVDCITSFIQPSSDFVGTTPLLTKGKDNLKKCMMIKSAIINVR